MKSNSKSKIIILFTLGILFALILIEIPNLSFISGKDDNSSDYSDIINLDTLKTSKVNVLYSEDFDDGVADFWETIGGTWAVEDKKYKTTGFPGERVRSYYANQNFSTYVYEGDFNLVSGDEMQIIFNVQDIFPGVDQGHYCQLTLFFDDPGDRKNTVILYSTQNFQATHTIVPYNFSHNQWYHFTVISSEADVEFFLNNSLVLSFSGVFFTSGYIGVKSMFGPTAYWDNIVVRQYEPSEDSGGIIPGYNLFFLISTLSLVAIIISKKQKKS